MKKKCVLITGSSKGLGEALAYVFAANGYNIILHGRDKESLTQVRKKVVKKRVNCHVVIGDLKSDKTVRQLFETAKNKNISVLINNAAEDCPYLAFEKISSKQIDTMLMTNLIAPIKLTKMIYSLFLKKGQGVIININSLSGRKNQELRSIYCASKWGLRGFADSFRMEAKKHKVRVLNIYPSRIKTKTKFTHGMEAEDVAKNIFDAYKQSDIDEVVLDERPKDLRRGKNEK